MYDTIRGIESIYEYDEDGLITSITVRFDNYEKKYNVKHYSLRVEDCIGEFSVTAKIILDDLFILFKSKDYKRVGYDRIKTSNNI